jgi:2-polyprenyl-3-methyl-5-hydroxy-6-metoxy-1,4-benzoquinol methylase
MAVTCPLCSSKDTYLITNRVRFDKAADVNQCRHCSLVFLDQISFKLPDDFYENEYHQTYLTHIEPSAFDPQSYYEKMQKTTKPWCDRINDMLTGREFVLDFGCSTGHLMTGIRGKAGKVFGHEVNRQEIEFCRNVLGLDVSGEALHTRFREEMFDFIIMIFVLEHIADPVGLLKYLKSFLKPNGRLVILVPNVQDALVQFYSIPPFAHFYYCVEHLFYYSPKTMADVFNMAGLKGQIETIQEYPITNHLNWGYRQKPSDVLASRRLVPDIPLVNSDMMSDWENFWMDLDRQYKNFLHRFGFGDRLWCLAEKDGRTG